MSRKERFQALAGEQLQRLYSIARRLTGEDAEDAVQDALLKAFQSFDQLRACLSKGCRDEPRQQLRTKGLER